MTPEIFQRIEPAVTVYSGRQFVDPQNAAREVLMAVPSMTPDGVESALAARARLRPMTELPAADPIASLRGRAFTIRAEFEKSNRKFTYEAAVRLTDDPLQPFWLLDWRVK